MTDTDIDAAPPRRNFYGRRRGKTLRPTQLRHLEELLPRLAVPLDGEALDATRLFGDARPMWLEIGFGGGEHLAHQAKANPGVGLIGCEPFINGVAMALNQIEGGGVENVRVHPGDARDLIDALPDAALARVFLLYPDPWPKARHHRRRFTSPENLAALARVMAPGAHLRLATDIADYVSHSLDAVAATPEFEMLGGPDWSTAWPDWPSTRYEAKALREGRPPHYLTFRRR